MYRTSQRSPTPRRRTALACAALCALGAWLPASASPQETRQPVELTVYAAASLRNALAEIAPSFEKASGTKIVFNFGASGDLAQQILAAAKADVFLSAGEKEMDLVGKLVEEGTRKTLLSNQLTVIEPVDPKAPERSLFTQPFTVEQLAAPAIERLSLANTDTVPAGRYAKAWLEKRGQWSALSARVLPGVDVRAALAAVESGGAQAGIVYKTDAALSKKVRVVHAVPLAEGPDIRYPIAAIAGRPELARAKRFLEHLATAESLATFERFGFVLPDPASKSEPQPEKK